MLPMSVSDFCNFSVYDAKAIIRKINFITRLRSSENTVCKLSAKNITDELAIVLLCMTRPIYVTSEYSVCLVKLSLFYCLLFVFDYH